MNTGYTPTPDIKTRIVNLVNQVDIESAERALYLSNGDVHEFERILTGMAQAENNAHAAMLQRRDEIERILNTVPLHPAKVDALTEELAEIYVHIGRNPDEDETADDYADYRRGQICGVGL